MPRERRYKKVPELFELSINSQTKWGEIVDLFTSNYPFYRKKLLSNFFDRDEHAVLIDLGVYKEFLVRFLLDNIGIYQELLKYLGVDNYQNICSFDAVQASAIEIDFADRQHESRFVDFRKVEKEAESVQLLSIVSAVQAIHYYIKAVEGKNDALKSFCLIRLMADMAQAHSMPLVVQGYERRYQQKAGRNPGFKNFLISIFKIRNIYSRPSFKETWEYLSENPDKYSTNQESYHLAVRGSRLYYREDQPPSLNSESIDKESVSKYFREAKKNP